MKKIIFLLLSITIFHTIYSQAFAMNTTYRAKLDRCVDSNAARFFINNATTSTYVQFLFIKTPQSVDKQEPFGKEASAFTCTALQNAIKIKLETEKLTPNNKKSFFAWIWIDNHLLQEKIAKAGFVKNFYTDKEYKYETMIRKAHAYAKRTRVGIYRDIITTTDTQSKAPIKMSKNKICHDETSRWYKRTKKYTAYATLQACLKAGGRLPKS